MEFNEIYKYEIINEILDKTKPWFDSNKGIIYIPNIKNKYNYYIECAVNVDKYGRQYYILLQEDKFNKNCRKCNIDGYGRLKIIVHGELLEFLKENIKGSKNINFDLQDRCEIYDAYCVSI